MARRNLAAVSASTGVVDPNIDPPAGSETNHGVRAIVALGTKVYLGGYFGSIDGKGRRFLGALDQSWAPEFDGNFFGPWDLLVEGNHLWVGGQLQAVDGVPRTPPARFTFG